MIVNVIYVAIGFVNTNPLSTVGVWRCGGFVVAELNSRSGGAGSSPSQGYCVVFLGKTIYSHSASLYPGL